MTRLTILSFLLLSGFFYVTGQPVDDSVAPLKELVDQKVKASGLLRGAALSKEQGMEAKVALDDGISSNATEQRLGVTSASLDGELSQFPGIPVRNPMRSGKSPAALKMVVATVAPIEADVKKAAVKKKEAAAPAIAAPTPLFASYQQRYVAPKKPVLGPRLTAVLMKRELRRVGCYSGNITGNWDNNSRAAVERFNTASGFELLTDKPHVNSLEKLQQITRTVCEKKQDSGRIILASTPKERLNAIRNKAANSWRSNVQRRKMVSYQRDGSDPIVVRKRSALKATAKPRRAKKYTRRRAVAKKRKRHSRRSRVAQRRIRRKTAIRGWRRQYRRKKFGFSGHGGFFRLNF